ncbi:MAG: hypothetical protein ACTSPQ_19975 [Candidatus Helarchaeota archaeon]
MELLNTTTKYKILKLLIKKKKPIGIYKIAKLNKISVSEVWRQIKVLTSYNLILKKKIGNKKAQTKYFINRACPLTNILEELFYYSDFLERIKNLMPLEACNSILNKYYISGIYSIKEFSWDIIYPQGFLLVVDETEYLKAELIKSYFINEWRINVIKKKIDNCEFYFDDFEQINKAVLEQAIADCLNYYDLDPNNIEVLFLLLLEDVDWRKLYKIIKTQYGDSILKKLWYFLSIARFLGAKLYPSDLFYCNYNVDANNEKFKQDAKLACYRILLCNGIYKKQWW